MFKMFEYQNKAEPGMTMFLYSTDYHEQMRCIS